MSLPDPLGLRYKILSTSVLSASFQLKGDRLRQEDAVFHNSTDTFVVADGIGGLPHGDTAAQLTVESTVWAVNLAKQRPAHWKDKKLLSKKILRSVNLTVYNKRKEPGFEEGLGSTLTLLFFGETHFNICNIGDSRIYLYRKKKIILLTPLDRDHRGYLTKAIGISKDPPEAFFYSDRCFQNDIFLLMTDGVGDHVSEEEMESSLNDMANTQNDVQRSSEQIVVLAKNHGSTDNMTVCLVKCIVY